MLRRLNALSDNLFESKAQPEDQVAGCGCGSMGRWIMKRIDAVASVNY